MHSSKSYFVLGLVCLFVVGGHGLRIARETEREGQNSSDNNDSNDVNRDRVVPGQDIPVNPMEGADDDDDDEWDSDDGQGFFVSWRPSQHNFQDMFTEFRRMETVMREMQNRIYNLTINLPQTVDNSTSEIITIDGRRYNVTRTVQRGDNNNTSFLFSATSIVPADKRRKREASLAESIAQKLHRKKRESESSDESGSEQDDG